jgi:hypothetical protein
MAFVMNCYYYCETVYEIYTRLSYRPPAAEAASGEKTNLD